MNVIAAMYQRWARGEAGDGDAWGDITTEPGGVDYLEVTADGVPALWVEPHGASRDRVIVYLHGGGFIGGSLYTHRKLVGHLAKATGVRALVVHYRLATEAPYPAQVEDALTAYRWVVDQGLTVALAGDSSGGGLAVLAALRIRDRELPRPAALLLISEWADMAMTGTTFETNAGTDVVFTREMVKGLVELYLAGGAAADLRVGGHGDDRDDVRDQRRHRCGLHP